MNAIAAAFEKAAQEDRALLIGYWPAGYPDVDSSIRIVEAMIAGGVDLMEIGWPYSDPVMDGPTIAVAADEALRAGTTPSDVLRVVAAAHSAGAAAAVMSYWNPIEHYGVSAFAKALNVVGGAGVITPDLVVEEADAWREATNRFGVARIFVAAPSSTPERLRLVAEASDGFVYAASMMGVTGSRAVDREAQDLVARIRPLAHTPIAVGLGVSTRQQAAQIAGYADGVIVGSAFVRIFQRSGSLEEAEAGVQALATELAQGVREAGMAEVEEYE
ncbi:MAG: tryptophan synthase subunit alpha [Actinobacteria bacterium]|nr:tryptophan synthase subunit alpha [Actinomycetota bacterium]